jgi:hypothetical protein
VELEFYYQPGWCALSFHEEKHATLGNTPKITRTNTTEPVFPTSLRSTYSSRDLFGSSRTLKPALITDEILCRMACVTESHPERKQSPIERTMARVATLRFQRQIRMMLKNCAHSKPMHGCVRRLSMADSSACHASLHSSDMGRSIARLVLKLYASFAAMKWNLCRRYLMFEQEALGFVDKA